MSSHSHSAEVAPLDLSKWRKLPFLLSGIGLLLIALGLFATNAAGVPLVKQFGYSWLVAFMFFLSFAVGGWFLVLAHHLFDASWSVPIRRITENIAVLLFPTLAILFLPIAFLAKDLYPWLGKLFVQGEAAVHADHALHAKQPIFTITGFYVIVAVNFLLWWLFSRRLRGLSLKQDQDGAAHWTAKLRVTASLGIVAFAITVTLASIMWMKSLMHQWFSTMYGVTYFAGSVWMTLATVYLIAVILKRSGPLRDVMGEKQFYFIGSLFFAFTVFYAYVTFSQYFIIWNANMPEETFWYWLREKGTWWDISMLIIFGHFFLPFLTLLRIDIKLSWWMLVMALWAWLMHFCDMEFQIMPIFHPNGVSPAGIALDLGCVFFMAGIMIFVFFKNYFAHPPYPQRDPRIAEGLDIYVPPVSNISTAPNRAK